MKSTGVALVEELTSTKLYKLGRSKQKFCSFKTEKQQKTRVASVLKMHTKATILL